MAFLTGDAWVNVLERCIEAIDPMTSLLSALDELLGQISGSTVFMGTSGNNNYFYIGIPPYNNLPYVE